MPEAARSAKPTAHPRGLTLKGALLITLAVAAVAHLLWMGGTVLVVTSDGVDYLSTAAPLYKSGAFKITLFRTPGYPLLLTLSFLLFGMNAFGIMILQHALSVAASLCITAIAGRYVKPWLALVGGLLFTLNPIPLGFASVMLTESVSIFYFVFPIFCILCWRSRPTLAALVAMAFFGYALLVRPGTQAAFPFILAATLLSPNMSWPKRGRVLAAGLAGFIAVCGPWLWYNHKRGIDGFSNGGMAALWVSLCQQDLLDKEYPLPDYMAAAYAPVKAKVGPSNEMWTFLAKPTADASKLPEVRKVCRQWAVHSIKTRFPDYLKRLPYAFAWQLNYFPEHPFIDQRQYSWFCWMLSRDSENAPERSFPGMHHGMPDQPDAELLGMPAHGGWVRRLNAWWATNQELVEGIPEIPLCLLSLAAGVIAIRRRDWPLAMCLLASAAVVGVHVLMVFHQTRYSLPAIAFWHATGMIPIAAVFPRLRTGWWAAPKAAA